VGGAIPIEESFSTIAGVHAGAAELHWCDEYWMEAYNVRDYVPTTENIPANRPVFIFASVALGVVLIAAAMCIESFVGRARRFPLGISFISSARR